jgi:hypothetical protein
VSAPWSTVAADGWDVEASSVEIQRKWRAGFQVVSR